MVSSLCLFWLRRVETGRATWNLLFDVVAFRGDGSSHYDKPTFNLTIKQTKVQRVTMNLLQGEIVCKLDMLKCWKLSK
jgi:hypothetical protein